MGRLRKTKIDMIVKHRKQGYTQAETAELTEVHLKTVQKYDPLRRPKRAASSEAARGTSVEDLESQLEDLTLWVEAIRATFWSDLEQTLRCPFCNDGEFSWAQGETFYVCDQCKNQLPVPAFMVYGED